MSTKTMPTTEAETEKPAAPVVHGPPTVEPFGTVQPQALAWYVQDGFAVDFGPAVVQWNAGDVIIQGSLVGVTMHWIDIGRIGAVQIDGVYDFLKKSGDAPGAGVAVYWDTTNKWATVTSTGMTYLGKTTRAALATDARIRIKLYQALP